MRELTTDELERVSGGAQVAQINIQHLAHVNANKNNININIKDDEMRLHLIINKNLLIKIRDEELKLNLRLPL